jgi:hypothetical protein
MATWAETRTSCLKSHLATIYRYKALAFHHAQRRALLGSLFCFLNVTFNF